MNDGQACAGPGEGQPPTAVIADDHPMIRRGVSKSLTRGGFQIVAEVADGDSAVGAVQREHPDLCLLDISMPGGGIRTARMLAELAPSTAVVMLTVSNDIEDLLAALRAGAVGYLTKDTSPDRLPFALCGVLRGEAALPRALFGRVLRESRDFSPQCTDPARAGQLSLTGRESEVLRLLHSGSTTTEVSEALSLSPITVRRHISTAVAKLGVADRRAAIQTVEPVHATA